MNRRLAIKQIFILAGGLAIASSCDRTEGPSIVLKKLKLTAKDEGFLGNLVDIVLPKTDSPGGKALNLHLFVMKMVDDCETPDRQDAFIAGLKELRAELNVADVQGTERRLLTLAEGSAGKVFFEIFKSRAIQGYMNSQYVMTNKVIYKLLPGPYNGAVKLKA